MRALVVVALLGACSNLEPIEPGVCGNGVVEPGEDCDAPGERCSSCSLVCLDAAAPDIPGAVTKSCGAEYDALGFICGPDNLCHAGTGTFDFPVSTLAAVQTFAVTPLDDDFVGDVLVQTPTGIQALRGVGDGSFVADPPQLSAIPTGPATFGDIDGDGRLDVLLPTPDGIAAFTSRFGSPTSQAFPSLLPAQLGAPITGQAANPDFGLFLGNKLGDSGPTNELVLVVFDAVTSGLVTFEGVCATGAAARLDRNTLTTFTVASRHVVIAMGLTRAGGGYDACVVDVSPTASGELQLHEIVPPIVLASRPVLVPSAGGSSQCPTLIAKTASEVLSSLRLESQNTSCVASSPSQSRTIPASIGALVAAAELGRQFSVLVFERAILKYSFDDGGAATITGAPIYMADRDITSVQAVDLDRDGLTDLIARSSSVTAPAEDLDILRQLEIGNSRGFLRLRYDTLGLVTETTVGDYDGDQWPDVAFVQTLSNEQGTTDELAIAYGGPSGLERSSSMGIFQEIRALIGIGFRDSIDPYGRVSDIAVLYRACREGTSEESCMGSTDQVTQLHGSPQRTLIGYFDPRSPTDDLRGVFGAVVLGEFMEGATDSSARDLIAIEHDLTCRASSPGEPAACGGPTDLRVWINDGALDDNIGDSLPKRFDIEEYQFPGQYVAMPRSEGELDLVIGVNVLGQGITYDPTTPNKSPVRWDSVVAGEPVQTVKTLKRAELVQVTENGALVTKLLLSFAGDVPQVRICALDDPFRPRCDKLEYGTGCADAAVLRLGNGAEPVSRLVAFCRVGDEDAVRGVLVEVDTSTADFVATELPILDDNPNGNLVRTGDVTGDGLDDILVLGRKQGLAEIRVYRQCNTRDLDCGGVGGGLSGGSGGSTM